MAQQVTVVLDPPSRQVPATFSAKADTMLGDLPTWTQQVNAVATEVSDNATIAEQGGITAAAAMAFIDSQKWVSGTTYAEGVCVWSPLSFLSYRRKSSGAGTTDPANDTTNWALVTGARIPRSGRTANIILGTSDCGLLIDATANTWTQTIAAASTLGNGWFCYYRNSGTGIITIDPTGSETIGGNASVSLCPGAFLLIQCDGSNFNILRQDRQISRLPIFSAAAASATPVSTWDAIYTESLTTGLSGAVCVIYSAALGLFVAFSTSASSYVATSPTGATWTLRTMPASKTWFVGLAGSGLVAVAVGDTVTATSSNGMTWASGGTLPAASIAISNMGLPAVGATVLCPVTGGVSLTTNGGTTWGAVQTLPAALYSDIRSINGKFWMVSNSSYGQYTSPTGATGSWTSRGSLPLGTSPAIWMDYNGQLCARDGSTGALVRTSDGYTWGSAVYGRQYGEFTIAGVTGSVANVTGGTGYSIHDGVMVVRYSPLSAGGIKTGRELVGDGTNFVITTGVSTGVALRIDVSTLTALFEV